MLCVWVVCFQVRVQYGYDFGIETVRKPCSVSFDGPVFLVATEVCQMNLLGSSLDLRYKLPVSYAVHSGTIGKSEGHGTF